MDCDFELLEVVHDSDDPDESIKKVVEIISLFLKQHESFLQPAAETALESG
jgi:hypothetical protein